MTSKFREGVSGDWSIQKFEISEPDAKMYNLQSIFSGASGRDVKPGTFYRLVNNRTVVMSNTPAELWDFRYFVRSTAFGNILIGGLGLGCVIDALLENEKIKKICIIEKSIDVIKLTSWKYKNNPNVIIINDDIFNWKQKDSTVKNIVFDCAWFDIWNHICADNYEEMKKLNRKYKNIKEKHHWCQVEVKRLFRQSERERKQDELFRNAFNGHIKLMEKAKDNILKKEG